MIGNAQCGLVEQRFFDDLVTETGESWWGHQTHSGMRRIQRRARILTDVLPRSIIADVLEVGCGTGLLTLELLQNQTPIKLTATDISPLSVQKTRDRCGEFRNFNAEVQDITALTYEDSSFDAAVGNSILHHCPTQSALRELHRVIRPGGCILFFEPNLVNPQLAFDYVASRLSNSYARHMQITPNERPFIRWSLVRLIEQAGFVGVKVRPFDFLHPLVPQPLTRMADRCGRLIEKLPGIREIGGSLQVFAKRQ